MAGTKRPFHSLQNYKFMKYFYGNKQGADKNRRSEILGLFIKSIGKTYRDAYPK